VPDVATPAIAVVAKRPSGLGTAGPRLPSPKRDCELGADARR
jgi:hypothetical protein